MIFADGFESLDTGQWSFVSGGSWIGAYDACSGPCSPTMDCLDLLAAGAEPFCSPQCQGSGSSCPGRGGVAGSCVLSGPTPDHCALLCDTSAPACPQGMDCFDVGGGGICLWPE